MRPVSATSDIRLPNQLKTDINKNVFSGFTKNLSFSNSEVKNALKQTNSTESYIVCIGVSTPPQKHHPFWPLWQGKNVFVYELFLPLNISDFNLFFM